MISVFWNNSTSIISYFKKIAYFPSLPFKGTVSYISLRYKYLKTTYPMRKLVFQSLSVHLSGNTILL